MKANITVGELINIAPAARTALKTSIVEQKPAYINAVETIQRTPTYASGNIGLLPVSFIVDTGAGVSLMSKTLQERLKFRID